MPEAGLNPAFRIFRMQYAGSRRRSEPSEDDDWLVGTVLAYERGVTGVSVIDARRVGDRPAALA